MIKIDQQALYPGEALQWLNGFEYLTYFKKGQADKPLIVFLPGWGHLGRIAYAGAGIQPKDFLAHAFLKKGYSFLAFSYPLEHPVYSQIYPHMHLLDWAQGAADIAQEICKDNNIHSVIPIHWSAAGLLITSFHQACKALKIFHPFSVSIEGTPPILIPPERTRAAEIQSNGLASVKNLYPNWHQQVCAMLNDKLAIKDYEEAFLGSFPIALLGNSLVYSNGIIQEDLVASIQDRYSFEYAEAPLVVNISGNSQQVPYHPLVDRASWGFVNERKIYHDYLSPITSHIAHFSDERWQDLLTLIRTFLDNLFHVADGNHFLFLGQGHAQKVVSIVEKSEESVPKFLTNLKQFFSP